MILTRPVLCPIDFSEASRGALRYGVAIAEHFQVGLTVVTVNDPLLSEAAELTAGAGHLADDAAREMELFFRRTFEDRPPGIAGPVFEVVTGQPAPEILRLSAERGCGLVVLSSHGATGFRKMFFGSTTERVLRETRVPVLVTPAQAPGPATLEDVRRIVRRIVVPADMTDTTAVHVRIATELAEALDASILLLHVVEPVRSLLPGHPHLPSIDSERRHRAERELERVIESLPPHVKAEALVAFGEPAEEISNIANDRDAGLIVIGLHASPVLGPRMGSVTYRVLCLAHKLVLAVPPASGR